MEFNLADLFESVVDVVPEQTAIVAGARRLTYAELDERANRLAHRLAAGGIGRGDFVGCSWLNGSEYLEAMLACFKIGAVPVNVNYRYVDTELRHLYADAGLVGLVHHRAFAARGRTGPRGHGRTPARARGRRRHHRPVPSPWAEDYEAALAGAEPGRGTSVPARATTSTASTRAARPAGPRACCGATRTSSSRPWAAAIPLQLGNVIDRPRTAGRTGAAPRHGRPAGAAVHARQRPLAGLLDVLRRRDPGPAARRTLRSRHHLAPRGRGARSTCSSSSATPWPGPLLDALEAARDRRLDASSLMAVGSGGAILSPSTKARLARLLPGRDRGRRVRLVRDRPARRRHRRPTIPSARPPARRRAHRRVRRRPATRRARLRTRSGGWPVAAGCRSATGATRHAPPPRSWTVDGQPLGPARRSGRGRGRRDHRACSVDRRSASTPAARRSTPRRSRPRSRVTPTWSTPWWSGLPDERWGERVDRGRPAPTRAADRPSTSSATGPPRPGRLQAPDASWWWSSRWSAWPSGKADYRWALAQVDGTGRPVKTSKSRRETGGGVMERVIGMDAAFLRHGDRRPCTSTWWAWSCSTR